MGEKHFKLKGIASKLQEADVLQAEGLALAWPSSDWT